MAYYCPNCMVKIVMRRLGYCTTCKEPLPEEMLLSKEEIEALEKEEAEIRKRREEREKKEEEAKRRKQGDDDRLGDVIDVIGDVLEIIE